MGSLRLCLRTLCISMIVTAGPCEQYCKGAKSMSKSFGILQEKVHFWWCRATSCGSIANTQGSEIFICGGGGVRAPKKLGGGLEKGPP